MKVYAAIRDWVDRTARGTGYRGVLLPGAIPIVVAVWIDDRFFWTVALIWLGLWGAFVGSRMALAMRSTLSAMKDEPYDRVGKYRLSKEYWSTESAAAARYRKKRSNG